MDVYLEPADTKSRALDRVSAAFARYPHQSINVVSDARSAQMVILQSIGRRDLLIRQAEQARRHGQSYAVIQYCVRSTQKPHTSNWLDLWRGARLVWSYYDLPSWCADDGTRTDFAFYHAPLGVDGAMFNWVKWQRDGWLPNVVLTSGRGWLTESTREVTLAARRTFVTPWHLGPAIGHGVESITGISDTDLVSVYAQCDYVSGLRRTEGFELPAAEGLMSGARPLLFDQPWYRDWFGDLGCYIREGDRLSVLEQLMVLFRKPVKVVTQAERDQAARRFHWPTILAGFWQRALA